MSVAAATQPSLPTPQANGEISPGRDVAGAPLADKDVWAGTAPKGLHTVNTGDGITQRELDKLGKFAVENPSEFFKRLHADSANGTPVEFEHTYKAGRSGVLHVKLNVVDGKLDAEATYYMYKKAVKDSDINDFFVDPTMSGDRPGLTLKVTGDIQEDGTIEGVGMNVDAVNIPAFDGEKIAGKQEMIKDLRDLVRSARRAQPRAILRLADNFVDAPYRFLPLILGEAADSYGDRLQLTATDPDNDGYVATGIFGQGEFDIKADHIISGDDHDPAEDLDVQGAIKGRVEEDGQHIMVDSASLKTTQKIDVKFPEGAEIDEAQVTADGHQLENGELVGMGMSAMFALSMLR